MKKEKFHIAIARLMFIVFIAGQLIVNGHQHNTGNFASGKITHHSSKQTVDAKCRLCDVMHHNHMLLNGPQDCQLVSSTNYVFTVDSYNFVSISLILSAGRSPPVC